MLDVLLFVAQVIALIGMVAFVMVLAAVLSMLMWM